MSVDLKDPSAPKVDLMSAQSFVNGHPLEQYHWLREQKPVYWYPEPPVGPGAPPPGMSRDGFWAVTNYEGVHAVARDNSTYSSLGYAGDLDFEVPRGFGLGSLIGMDDPVHAAIRKVVSDKFTPRSVRGRTPELDRIARDIVNEMCELGECDLVPMVAGKIASYVGAEILGIPRDEAVAMYHHVETIHGTGGSFTPEQIQAAQLAEFVYSQQVWQRKREEPADDIASQMAFGSVSGQPMDEGTFISNFTLLIHGSSDTTRNLVSGGVLMLLEHPDQLAMLRSNFDELIGSAIEEMLRWLTPVVWVPRIATRDTLLCGQEIKKGDMVVIWYGAANHDPAKFVDPDRFDIQRSPNDHIAFGFAGHFCLGVHLARLQARAILRELLVRVPDLSLAGPVTWLDGTLTTGPASMPVSYSPVPALR